MPEPGMWKLPGLGSTSPAVGAVPAVGGTPEVGGMLGSTLAVGGILLSYTPESRDSTF